MHPAHGEPELVRAAQRGDREAFARLYDMNVERVYNYLSRRLPDPADAEDVTAEVFIRAMDGLPKYKDRGAPLIAWLIRIAHNLSVNHVRKQANRRESPLVDNLPAADDPAELAVQKVTSEEVGRAMRDLTDLQREVLHLRFAGELSISETARVMRRTEGAVKFLQHSALRALRRVLAQQGVTGYAR